MEQKTITVKITNKNFLSGWYEDGILCPLALALKDLFSHYKHIIKVGYGKVEIDGKEYSFDKSHEATLKENAGKIYAEPLTIILTELKQKENYKFKISDFI